VLGPLIYAQRIQFFDRRPKQRLSFLGGNGQPVQFGEPIGWQTV
jgi:hypothetical protein